MIRRKSSAASLRKRKVKTETTRLRSDRTTFILGETAAPQRMRLVRVFGGRRSSSRVGLCRRQRALDFRPVFSFRGNPHRDAPGAGAPALCRRRGSSPTRAPHESPARLVDDPESVPTLAPSSDLRRLFMVRHRGLASKGRGYRNRFQALRRSADLRRVCRVDGGPRLANILVAIEKSSGRRLRNEILNAEFSGAR